MQRDRRTQRTWRRAPPNLRAVTPLRGKLSILSPELLSPERPELPELPVLGTPDLVPELVQKNCVKTARGLAFESEMIDVSQIGVLRPGKVSAAMRWTR